LAVSTEIFTELKEEKSGSIQLLNSSAMQLITTGEMLIKNGKVKEGVKCLAEARNAMKTKLDYMKFGKDLIGGMK